MKKIFFGFFCIVILCMSGCFKVEPTEDIFVFRAPATVQLNSTMELVVSSKAGVYLAPELESKLVTEIDIGDLIFTLFYVNFSKPQSLSGFYTAYDINWAKVYTRTPVATEDGVSETGDYDSPIKEIEVLDFWKNFLYFGLVHSAPKDQQFTYEMTYDINETGNSPTVYIRAKKTGEEITGEIINTAMFYAFDMTELGLKFKDLENKLNLNVKFKTGVNNDGDDVFKNFPYNPIFIQFE